MVDNLTLTQMGRVAEFRVCADLTSYGYHVEHVDAPGFDVMMIDGGYPLRVQVKTSGSFHSGRQRWRTRVTTRGTGNSGKNCLKEPMTRANADLFALVWRPTGKCIYVPIDKPRTAFDILPSIFDGLDTLETLERALDLVSPAREGVTGSLRDAG